MGCTHVPIPHILQLHSSLGFHLCGPPLHPGLKSTKSRPLPCTLPIGPTHSSHSPHWSYPYSNTSPESFPIPSKSVKHGPSLLPIGQSGSTQVRPIHGGVVKAVLRGTGAAGVSGASLFSGLGRFQLGRSFCVDSRARHVIYKVGGTRRALYVRGGVSGTFYMRAECVGWSALWAERA